MWTTLLSGQEVQGELLNRKKNGDRYWEHTLIAPITDPTGTITHFVAIKEDVTAPKRAEEALQMAKAELEMKVSEQTAALREVNRQLMDELDLRKQAEQRFRTLFEEAPVMYVIAHNQEGLPVIADCNRKFPSVMGYDKAKVLGRALADFYTPSSRAKLESGGYQSALENRFTVEERQLVTRQGPIIETVLQAVPEIDAQGQTVGTRAMYVDIPGRRKAERMFQGLLEVAPDAMVIARQDGEIALVNAQAERLFGYGREELVGQSHRILHSELARSGQVGELARYFSSPNTRLPGTRLELQARRRDCSEFPVDVSLSPLETGEGLLISATIPGCRPAQGNRTGNRGQ